MGAAALHSIDVTWEAPQVREQWHDAATLMQSRVLSQETPIVNPKIGIMYMALTLDFVWLAIKMMAIVKGEEIGIGCDFLFTLIWYPLTLYVLGGVFPGTDLWQGVDMVTQQLTSIGYGGANVRGNDQKLFHAVNGMASQMGPNNIPGWLVRFYVDWAFASSPFPKMIDNQTSSINLTDEIRENVTKRWGDWIEKEDDSKILGAIAFEKKEHWKQVIKGIMLLVFGMLTFILLYDPNKNGHLEAFYATL